MLSVHIIETEALSNWHVYYIWPASINAWINVLAMNSGGILHPSQTLHISGLSSEGYMVQDLSRESWGAGGCGAGLDLGRTTGLGLKAGGLSCTPMRGATTGLKVLMASLEELVLRRIGGSVLAVDLSITPWMGLRDSLELAGVGPPPLLLEVCRCSRVSSTTSGACLAELWRSSSRNSFRAVFIVSSMSCRSHREREREKREGVCERGVGLWKADNTVRKLSDRQEELRGKINKE